MKVAEGGTQSRALLLGGGIGIFGASLFAISAITIHSFIDAVLSRAPIIMWDNGGWIALPVALSLLAIALALIIGGRHAYDADGPRRKAIKRLLLLALFLLPLVIVFPFSAHRILGWQLEARGYVACGQEFWIDADGTPDPAASLARCKAWRQA